MPYLICAFDKDGVPVTNPDAVVGMELTVLALPDPNEWKTSTVIECFGPKYFGFDIDYTPYFK